jgi:hypothetical protein
VIGMQQWECYVYSAYMIGVYRVHRMCRQNVVRTAQGKSECTVDASCAQLLEMQCVWRGHKECVGAVVRTYWV